MSGMISGVMPCVMSGLMYGVKSGVLPHVMPCVVSGVPL